jgi:hypothetical protein
MDTAKKQPVQIDPPKFTPEQFTTLSAAAPTSVAKQIDEIMRRIRLLEERYSGIRKKSQFVEQSMLKDVKDMFEEFKAINETVTELKLQMAELAEKLGKLSEEVDESVTKAELNTVSKYLEFWQPLDFMTRKQAEEMLKK